MRHMISTSYSPRYRGIAIAYIAVILSVLIGVVGLAADTAYVFLTGHQLQNAADAAALAGAQEVGFNTTTAISNAVSIAAANMVAGVPVQLNSATDVQVGNYVRSTATFTANTAPYNACKVTANRTSGSLGGSLKLIFGPIFGIRTSNVTRSAIAVEDVGPAGVGLLVLSPSGSTVVLSGGGSSGYAIVVTGANMVVDSNSSSAIVWSGHPYISATGLLISGNDTAVNTGDIYPGGTALLNQTPLADPYASLAAPAKPSNTISTVVLSGSSPTTLQPGYYSGGITASGSGPITLASGIYWIDGGINLSGSAPMNATAGCLIYLHTGGITMSGSSTFTYAPISSGTYAGFSIYQDRSNSSAMALSGSTGVTNAGILYLPDASFAYSGTSTCMGSQLICKSLTMSGGTQININSSSVGGATHTAYLVQ